MVASSARKTTINEIQITERNVLIIKTLLNIAHCLCHILDVKSWYLIFDTMQTV